MSGCFSEAEELPSNKAQERWTPAPHFLGINALRRCKMPTPRERICELEKAAIEHQSVEKWIEIDRKLDPNWTEEKSKALYQRKEEWLKGCTERLNEARANLRAAEEGDIWSLLGT
jgi:hypothetical protein